MCFFPELLYNNILLLCCLGGVSSPMRNNNDNNSNNNNAEDELHEVGSNRPACASCKHQRKKCIEGDCVMWRHFPASKMDEFLGVHKVFGISNVTKKIKSLDDVAKQDESIKSFLWEAKLWQEDPIQGPLGEYKKLEQQLNEEKQRNKQQQIVQLRNVPLLPPSTTSESRARCLPPLAVHHNRVVPRNNNNILSGIPQVVPNYTNLLQCHGEGGQTTSNIHDLINIGVGNNMFGFGNFPNHYGGHGFIPRLQGIVHDQATHYHNGGHVQSHQQRFPYNNVDLGHGKRRKELSDPYVSPIFSGSRHVRGREIGPIVDTSSLGGPIITPSSSLAGPIIANAARTMLNPGVNGRHVEDGTNQRPEDVATVLQDFTNYNHNDLPGEHKRRDLESRDDSTSKRL